MAGRLEKMKELRMRTMQRMKDSKRKARNDEERREREMAERVKSLVEQSGRSRNAPLAYFVS